MKTIGFVISHKENEKRRAIIPEDISKITNKYRLFIEKGYGLILGYSDKEYIKMGVNIVEREEAYQQEIVCSPKAPELEEQKLFREGQTLFGWIHAVQGREITDFMINKKMKGVAWEDMYENGRHVFWRNNELAGEAGIWHAFHYYGRMPYECEVAVLGKGNTARGVIKILDKLGANVSIYDRKTINLLRREITRYDVIVNCVLWDVFSMERLLYKDDIKRMKKGSMIIDISCNHEMEIETSHPTTIINPIYYVNGVLHYVVDHTASILWRAASESISSAVCKYIDRILEDKNDRVLKEATIIDKGEIIDQRITRFQKR